ncbi:SpoIIE family protein phosphatase [Streptomyces sp. NPDC058572]|uniref:SpoIIE family protein phosphatase n=1 Tax=Streptomyces sp. NPDC058572 TaxID=3346546 RepID=UPI0036489C55
MSDADAPIHDSMADGMGAALLDALFSQSTMALYVLDTNLRTVRVDTASPVAPVGSLLGRRFTEIYRLERPDEAERLLERALDTGAPTRRWRVRGRRADGSGPDRSFTVSFYRLTGSDRATPGVLVLVADVSEEEQARSRAAALDAVRERVGQSLDLVATCRDLADALVPAFADIAVVDVVEEVLRGAEPPLQPLTRDSSLRRTAFRGPGGADAAYPVGDVRDVPYPTPYAQALSDLRPRRVTLGPDTPWLAADPARSRAIEATGAHSLIVAPLALRGMVLGAVSLYRCKRSEPFSENDLSFTATLAAHTALSIDNARRYARDHTIASTVQRRLLPYAAADRVAVETAHLYFPGRNSGCWFDTIALSGARTALVVGNVHGRGIHTATAMGQLRTAVQALAALDLEPDELLARLNDTAVHLASERAAFPSGDMPRTESLTATCLFCVYDPFTRTLTMARAGHAAPLVVHPDGSTQTPEMPQGPQLSASDSAPFATAEIELTEGSVLALTTGELTLDGRPDTPGSVRPTALREVLSPPGRPLSEMCDALVYHLPPDAHPDGAALLLARTGSVVEDCHATYDLEHDRTAPKTARTLVRERLVAWDLGEEEMYAAELVVSELVTNAVRYGAPPVRLHLIKTHTLTCEVHDTGTAAPHLRHARTVDEHGRGLFIINQLAAQWGTRYTRDGKIIWAELGLPQPTG